MNKNTSYLILAILIAAYFIYPDSRLMLVFTTWIYMMAFCLMDIEKRLTLFAFDLAIFTFLLTRLIIPLFYEDEYTNNALSYTMSFSNGAYEFINNAIFISLIASFIGFNGVRETGFVGVNFDCNNAYTSRIRNLARKAVYFCAFFCFLTIVEKIYYVGANGYEELYLSYQSHFPSIFNKFVNVYTLVFYLFLGTLPSKKEAKPVIIIYIVLGALSLLTGARSEFILNCILVITYMFLRNKISPDDIWIDRKGKMALLVTVPVICALMFVVMLVRGGNTSAGLDVSSLFIDFFFQQGSSMQVVGLTFDAQNEIPDGKFYSLGALIDNYNHNFIFELLGIAKSYRPQTPEYAINGHSLANYLTYTYQTQRFLNGGGMGSSYIAEVWNDFGYLGLAIWSWLYGHILAKFYVWAQKSMWYLSLVFFMLVGIVYSPRGSAIDFISDILSPTNLVVMYFFHLYGKRKIHF